MLGRVVAAMVCVVAAVVRVVAAVAALVRRLSQVQNGSFFKGRLVQNRHYWILVRVRALERSKTAHVSRQG